MKTRLIACLVLLAAGAAQAGSWEDANGVTHFYKDPPKPNLDAPKAYGIDADNAAAAQARLEADRQRWAREEQAAAERAKEQYEQQMKAAAVRAQIGQADAQRAQAAAQREQARQMAINNQIQAQRLLWGR